MPPPPPNQGPTNQAPTNLSQFGPRGAAPQFPLPYNGPTLLVLASPFPLPPLPFVPHGSTFVQPIQPLPRQLRQSRLVISNPSALDTSKTLEELKRILRAAEEDVKLRESFLNRYLQVPELNPSYMQTITANVNEH
jgi:hypothetical protein